MHPDPIVRAIHTCALAGAPIVLWGPPGSGKTARMRAYSTALNIPSVRWLLSRCEPIDLKPRAYAGNGEVVVSDPPEIKGLLGLLPALDRMPRALLFLDELNRASREVEGAALDRIDSPPPGVFVGAACNPPSRGQAARALQSAAANRFCHIEVATDAQAFAGAQINGWETSGANFKPAAPAAWDAAHERAGALLSAFIRRNPGSLEKEPDNPIDAGKAWPSTRTWEMVRNIHAALLSQGYDLATHAGDYTLLIAGCVGQGAALEYLTFVQQADLPDPEALLSNPTSYAPPEGRIDRTVAALTAVAAAIGRDLTKARWQAAWKLADQCVNASQADAAMVLGEMLTASYQRALRDAVTIGKTAGKSEGDVKADFEKRVGAMHAHIPDRLASVLAQTGKR